MHSRSREEREARRRERLKSKLKDEEDQADYVVDGPGYRVKTRYCPGMSEAWYVQETSNMFHDELLAMERHERERWARSEDARPLLEQIMRERGWVLKWQGGKR